ncbi:MAG: 3-phosphoshikimate 1-carboxyvinyltransferase [Candidatus Eisenbacteria bacterium]|uniref:3-phosphoshikimate 1-carboxyvinyltransferase n=1 Tax=Eiseniibacteriota bacterium TaxID=2212470 RepID=A0A956N9I5_UNCEI|nr:3-phosphoshikimate 1-carboxyvinyltransferase [Candidatus Eisenbacteria bacterium]
MTSLRGTIRVVPDKSLTHRGAIFGAITRGRTVLTRPNPGADCQATLRAVAALGARVVEANEQRWVLESDGVLSEPTQVLDLGNSGTGIRLLAGLVSGLPGLTVLTGDDSLCRRPMARIADPLRSMGARISTREGGRAPLAIEGGALHGVDYRSPVASAQVKSALLLAGLSLREGQITLEEPERSRDHTERLLRFYGVPLEVGETRVTLRASSDLGPAGAAGTNLSARSWLVPGDISAAAFFLVGAALAPGSELVIDDVGLNPTRTGAIDVLRRMGAGLEIETTSEEPEPIGRLVVRSSELRATIVEPGEIPRLVDEVPILALAAARAEGTTEFRGAQELRHKESDRVRTTLELLRVLGVQAEESEGVLRVHGRGPKATFSGGAIRADGDHRIAMTGLIASLLTDEPLAVDSRDMIATSDPGFEATLQTATGGAAQ